MRADWRHLAYALAALPVVAVVFAWIGFFNIGAASGHWKITEVVLHGLMRSAVKTYSFLEIEAPHQLPMEAIAPAAGHFARGCAICHGAPGEPRSPAADRMLPQPPDLVEKVGEWNDAELFWIVKYGIRFTGMPAWPTQARDDEVWAMVAFLRKLPGLDAAAYRNLAYGGQTSMILQPRGFDQAVAECARCHGKDGLGGGEFTPILAGQTETYLRESLHAYSERHRRSGIMALPALAIEAGQIAALADNYSGLPSPLAPLARSGTDAAQSIVMNGDLARGIPACIGCHGDRPGRNPVYPNIAGQKAGYIAGHLRLFRAGRRGGTPYAHLMQDAAKRLTDSEIDALARFLASTSR